MFKKKQFITIFTVGLISFLLGSLFSVTAITTDKGGGPFDKIWEAIYGLEERQDRAEVSLDEIWKAVSNLEERLTALEEQMDLLSQAELEKIVTEFLKTTDVPNGGWDGTVEVKEIYDHKLGGKVMIVKYTTANAGHPGFFWEAIERHIAVITLNMRGEVVSAFCVWGNFHDGKIWDLPNQRWLEDLE